MIKEIKNTKNQIVLHDNINRQWLHFTNPEELIAAYKVEDVIPALKKIHERVNKHKIHAAGFVAYDAAPAFDEALVAMDNVSSTPLLWFGLYSTPQAIIFPNSFEQEVPRIGDWTPSISESDYHNRIGSIKEYLARGDTYQVNFTYKLRASFTGNPWNLFIHMIHAQRANYGVYLENDDQIICSASPELFFQLNGNQLMSKPMKGTAQRGLTLAQDLKWAHWLSQSEKNRAENIMIVDLIRNDMGRIAETGSVQVPSLFNVERYPNVYQMTSSVTARTQASLPEVFRALFPCGSVTGAPKYRTMEIIRELENEPRGIYTGSLGYIAPDHTAQFNVAIRTLTLNCNTGTAEFGVGSGIVWDSNTDEEYNECKIKAQILSSPQPEFKLLETILWTPENGYFLLDKHLHRLSESGEYFDFNVDTIAVKRRLVELEKTFSGRPIRIRLKVDRSGTISLETDHWTIPRKQPILTAALAKNPIDPSSQFLYHKTSHRVLYDQALKENTDVDEVLLWNPQDEVTEFTRANIVVQLDGEKLTPPVVCGLLPGTFRDQLLVSNRIKERVIQLNELKNAQQIFGINSIRRWFRIKLNL